VLITHPRRQTDAASAVVFNFGSGLAGKSESISVDSEHEKDGSGDDCVQQRLLLGCLLGFHFRFSFLNIPSYKKSSLVGAPPLASSESNHVNGGIKQKGRLAQPNCFSIGFKLKRRSQAAHVSYIRTRLGFSMMGCIIVFYDGCIIVDRELIIYH
jgi:hypothetical protein